MKTKVCTANILLCRKCKAENSAQAQFCTNCGRLLIKKKNIKFPPYLLQNPIPEKASTVAERRCKRSILGVFDTWFVLTNLYVPKKSGDYAEIDLLVVNQTGFYVIESKDYAGKVSGQPGNLYWTQDVPGNSPRPFYSPALQNEGHIAALKEYLGERTYHNLFYSYLVFSDKTDISGVSPHPNHKIITEKILRETFMADVAQNSHVVWNWNALYQALAPLQNLPMEKRKKHIQYVHGKAAPAQPKTTSVPW